MGRWLSLGLLLVLLLLFAQSYFRYEYVECRWRNAPHPSRTLERAVSISSHQGQLALALTTFHNLQPVMGRLPAGFHHYAYRASVDPTDEWFQWSGYSPPVRRFAFLGLGFSYVVADDEPALDLSPAMYLSQYRLLLPFWFLSALAALALLWVWRKTGAMKPGQGFPVVMAAKEGQA